MRNDYGGMQRWCEIKQRANRLFTGVGQGTSEEKLGHPNLRESEVGGKRIIAEGKEDWWIRHAKKSDREHLRNYKCARRKAYITLTMGIDLI